MSVMLLTAVLAIWLVLSIVYQCSSRIQFVLNRFDPFGLLPNWSLFAQDASTEDYRLVYRDLDNNDISSGWHEAPICRRRIFHFVWNPDKHKAKAFTDLVQTLFRTCETLSGGLEKLPLTWPYLAILSYITVMPRRPNSARRQFAIVATSSHSSPRKFAPIFVSLVHEL
jgi:hypothetical protein